MPLTFVENNNQSSGPDNTCTISDIDSNPVRPLHEVASLYTRGALMAMVAVDVDNTPTVGTTASLARNAGAHLPSKSFSPVNPIVFSTPPACFQPIRSTPPGVSPDFGSGSSDSDSDSGSDAGGGVGGAATHALLRCSPETNGNPSLECSLRKLAGAGIRGAVYASERKFRARELDMMIPCVRGAGTTRTAPDGTPSTIFWRVRVAPRVRLWNRSGGSWPEDTGLEKFDGCDVRVVVRLDRIILGNTPECVFVVTDIESDGSPKLVDPPGEPLTTSAVYASTLSVSNLACLLEARDRIERLLEEHLAQQKPHLK